MENQQAYNEWAASYNAVVNLTRDLELIATQTTLNNITYKSVLELGCGTGKNTAWLSEKAVTIIAVDFSENMLSKAKELLKNKNVKFVQADINAPWHFINEKVDLITCSLVLEHIEDLGFVFEQASAALIPGGYFYIGELHPFKQYSGSKARFNKGEELIVPDCFTHHFSDYICNAITDGFEIASVNEWFDEGDDELPRILSLLFKKKL